MDLDAELRATARAHLARLLPKVLEDGHVDENEKEQLLAVFRRGILTTADVREVFSTFLKGLAGEVMADGVVTPEEQERCRIAVRELRSLQRRSPLAASPIEEGQHPAAPVPADHTPGELWAAARRILHPQQHAALWLRYGEDLPVRDVAKVMGRPRVWVSVTLHRACATLRGALGSPAAMMDDRPRPREKKQLAAVRASSETTSRGLP